MRIGRVLPTRGGADLLREALTWAKQQSLDCMYLLVDSNDAAMIRLAGEFGWRIVDVRVTLGTVASKAKRHVPVRPAKPEDVPYLRQIAMTSHKDSRFYADGNFPTTACDQLFAIWIERSVLDPVFAGAVFVPELEESKPAGYITCAMKQGVGEIGLIAVAPQMRGRGLGTGLLAQAATWSSEQGAQRISVVTQGCNIPALRMYERYGFSADSLQLWFHWWRTSSPGGRI
jgi:dTDP-4-amino-4,6-dideoxy-D-galactose acyltransferase